MRFLTSATSLAAHYDVMIRLLLPREPNASASVTPIMSRVSELNILATVENDGRARWWGDFGCFTQVGFEAVKPVSNFRSVRNRAT